MPDTNDTYYIGRINGNLLGVKKNDNEPNHHDFDANNSLWYVIFNTDISKVYISSSVGYEAYTGALIFGNIDNSVEIFQQARAQNPD